MANNSFDIYKTRIAAIIIIAAGYGWAGGHYIPNGSSLWAYIFQMFIIILLLTFSMAFISMYNTTEAHIAKSRWPVKALGIFALATLLINIANVINGALSNDAASFGSHNTLADLIPVCIIMAGDVLWLATSVVIYNGGRKKGQSF